MSGARPALSAPSDASAPPRARAASAAAPARALLLAATPDATSSPEALGSAHPLILEASSADGRWIVVCQARNDTNGDGAVSVSLGPRGEFIGDELGSYLLAGPGPGEAIDALLAFDASGRSMVTATGNRVLLRDFANGATTDLADLGADTRQDASLYRPHRALSFDRLGRRLLYLRRTAARTVVVVRELGNGHEITLDPGAGEVWRAGFDPSGRWVVLSMILQDTNGNGRLEWPEAKAEQNRWRCQGPIPKKRVAFTRGDMPVTLVLPAEGGRPESLPGLVAPLGADFLMREPGGRLVLRDAKGTRYELASAACEARVLHADWERGVVLGVCTRGPEERQLLILGRGLRVVVGLELNPPRVDAATAETPRLVPVYPGRDAALVDLDQRKLYRLEPSDAVLGTDGPRALVRRRGALWLLDVTSGSPRRLVELGAELGDWVQSGAVVGVGSWVVDVAKGRLLGRVGGRPLAVTRSGLVLVAGQDADAQHLAVGPLGWKLPE